MITEKMNLWPYGGIRDELFLIVPYIFDID